MSLTFNDLDDLFTDIAPLAFDGDIGFMETGKGWDMYPQLSPDDAFDYVRRCHIPRLEQVYDGHARVPCEY